MFFLQIKMQQGTLVNSAATYMMIDRSILIDNDSNSFLCTVHTHLTIIIIITPHLDVTI